ncbi:MAG: CaiB/BaiF CoA-transferase family protein [Gammaproteobacteria bacterium]
MQAENTNTSPGFGALQGVKVVDLTRVLGGPYCTQIFADHGADVIKVEPPQGDEVRDWGPPFHDNNASYFIGLNRNKRSIGLDLTQPGGVEVLFRLLEEADVLIENLKPGTMERWGLGYQDVLQPRFPRLIHCRISGYGSTGPLGGFPGYDAIIQAMAGWFSVNGDPAAGPTRVGIPMVDMGTGLYAAVAVLMALLERQHSGQGQYIDMTLYDCALALMHPHVINYYLSGKVPGLTGNAHPNISPYDRFRTRTVDIFIGAGNNRAFQRVCTLLERPDLAADPRFADNRDRTTNRQELTAELESVLVKLDGEEVCQRLLDGGIPAGPILDTAQAMHAEHTRHRDMAVEKDWYRCVGTPIKFSRTPGQINSLPPQFSEHYQVVLEQHGFTDEELKALIEKGIVVEKRRK